jgi:hypothetical protein
MNSKASYSLLTSLVKFTVAVTLAVVFSPAARAEAGDFVYSVPVKDSRLKPYATFELANAGIDKSAESVALGFDLPDQLVGSKPVHVALTGKPGIGNDVFQLEAPNASASCRATNDQTMCNVRYSIAKKYGIDLALHLFIEDPKNYFKRLEVAKEFSGDPIGTITIKNR